MSNRRDFLPPNYDRLIFLDFDGVLNDPYWLTRVWVLSHRPGFFELDPVRMDLLYQVCIRTNAKLVLSSSWNLRKGVAEMFSGLGFKVVGQLGYFDNRGDAIEKWLNLHYTHHNMPEYLILDDESSDYSEEQLKHLIKTAPEHQSWTSENIDKAPKLVGFNETHAREIERLWK